MSQSLFLKPRGGNMLSTFYLCTLHRSVVPFQHCRIGFLKPCVAKTSHYTVQKLSLLKNDKLLRLILLLTIAQWLNFFLKLRLCWCVKWFTELKICRLWMCSVYSQALTTYAIFSAHLWRVQCLFSPTLTSGSYHAGLVGYLVGITVLQKF